MIEVVGPKQTIRSIVESSFLNKYIPAVTVSEKMSPTGLILKLDTSDHFKFLRNRTSFEFVFPKDKTSTQDLISVIDYCLEFKRQKNKVYSVHGSACYSGDKALLFFGPVSGLGKTSLVLELVINRGYSPIGDEKILIHESGSIVGGCAGLSADDFVKKIFKDKLKEQSFVEACLKAKDQMPVRATKIVLPIIAPGSSLSVERWSPEEASWHLYEEVSRKIRGISRRVAASSFALPSIDTPELSQKRIQAVDNLTQAIPFYVLRGDLETVAKRVVSL